ncbi:translin-associated protein X-like [Uloborus diversus]|uniref:translin-associated protein X-like n=1 Tax=Uloborus diversus TaxID=327109 RepID=UPI002409E5DB|nr:translin-associated protein X-like [Uloborus diversus]
MNDSSHKGRPQRKRKIPDEEKKATPLPENASHVARVFQSYQCELDAKYDKYERLVKKSRDLTIESKRIIFLLHRVMSSSDKEEILHEAEVRLNTLMHDVIDAIASELTKPEVYQFLRAFSPGLQEFVEAVSFYHYLKNGSLIHIDEVCNPNFSHIIAKDTPGEAPLKADLPLSSFLFPLDFVLGIADLTGELMRKCINSVGAGDIEEPFKLCVVLQDIHDAFLIHANHSKELKRKFFTLKCSLQKVESACYAIRIRGTEVPKHMLADFFSNEEEVPDCDI